MDGEAIDWKALARLRAAFLEGSAGQLDYWKSESDLASYDSTFAQRIGWKWDYVLEELRGRGWTPPRGDLVDWGCGSGVAGRAYLDHFGVESSSSLTVWDRSPLAREFSRRKASARFPTIPVRALTELPAAPGTLLLSHVLTELSDRQLDEVAELAARATAVLWVEPGSANVSRRLIGIRERFRATFHVVAPCPHQATCGMLAAGNENHWCHHFASPPPAVFTDGNWQRFGNLVGIDLRSLPLSFLVLDKCPAPRLPESQLRIIGHPRLYKAHAQVFACNVDGVKEYRLNKRTMAQEFRRLKKGLVEPLPAWGCQGDEIAAR